MFSTFISMSMSKAQAEALAEGFLDDIGTADKGVLVPRETFTELFLLAAEFIEQAQENLIASNSIASGSLSSSLAVSEGHQVGNVLKVDVMMNFYGDFVNSGVRGTKGGAGKYAFKSEFPSKKMVQALAKGIDRARASSSNVRHTVSGHERKNQNLSAIEKAYGAGRNIKRYGIKANGFIDKAVTTISNRMTGDLGDAFRVDIINSL